MKKNYVLVFTLFTFLFSAQLFSQVNVTFRVDMSAQSVSSDGVHIAGSLNGWNTTSTMLTQEGSTNIYSVVIPLDSGWYEYKFLNGNAWGTDESAISPCAASNGNRLVYINDSGNDVILESVPFGACNPDATGFTVTFNVDMSNETSISTDGVHIAGSLNGWNTENLLLTEVSENIFSKTLRLPTPANYPVVFEYKYLNGNAWGTEETPDSNCSTVSGTNRLVTVSNTGENLNDIFNGCTTLGLEELALSALEVSYNKNLHLLKIRLNETTQKLSNIKLFESTGKLIYVLDKQDIALSTFIDVSTLNKGLYFLQMSNENEQRVKKILIY